MVVPQQCRADSEFRIFSGAARQVVMQEARDWITRLHLTPHPEGGYFSEVYRSSDSIARAGLPARYPADRISATSIYFLLEAGDVSKFHRLLSDEIWCYHAGSPLTIYALEPGGTLRTFVLGICLDNHERPQVYIPHGTWFGARVNPAAPDEQACAYTLVSCLVAPGFEFDDFELASYEQLAGEYPQHQQLIEQLT
jgi:predicted cupin superfamily sugar epimerase